METVETTIAPIKPATPSPIRPLAHNGVPERCYEHFQMPLHYPRFTREEYKNMPEWKLDCLLIQYGLPSNGNIEEKRRFAIGAFCWTTPTVVKVSNGSICSSKLWILIWELCLCLGLFLPCYVCIWDVMFGLNCLNMAIQSQTLQCNAQTNGWFSSVLELFVSVYTAIISYTSMLFCSIWFKFCYEQYSNFSVDTWYWYEDVHISAISRSRRGGLDRLLSIKKFILLSF